MQNNLTSQQNKLNQSYVVYIYIYNVTFTADEKCYFSHPYYIEVTSNTLKTRITQQKYKAAIKSHLICAHIYNNTEIKIYYYYYYK